MLITQERVSVLTGTVADGADIQMAQGIIEAFVGRTEHDVDGRRDLELLELACAYQVAYMAENPGVAFEQVATSQIGQNGSLVSFDRAMFAPYLAPLAVIACRNVSWRKSRSVRTGSFFGNAVRWPSWVTD